MGSGLYGASKAIALSDHITTVTPERRMEDSREEPGENVTNQMCRCAPYCGFNVTINYTVSVSTPLHGFSL